jgi:hypothetical protein
MGERGPHDDFESAKQRALLAYETFNRAQDIDELREKFFSEDLEFVNRQGRFHGPDALMSEMGVQLEQWAMETDVEEVIDAGEGAIVLYLKVKRKDRETGEVIWKAWPAAVIRVLDGKCVFFEGYVDRRQALADLGVEQG